MAELTDVDLLALDYDGKVKLLEAVTRELLDLRLEFATISGRHAELRANLQATAEQDAAKLQAEWQAAMAKTNERLDQMQAELKQSLQRPQK